MPTNACTIVLTGNTLDIQTSLIGYFTEHANNPVISVPPNVTYLMRAWDSGTAGWVQWSNVRPAATPLTTDTQPNYSGTLSLTHIVKKILLR